jgi:hypothetical protein
MSTKLEARTRAAISPEQLGIWRVNLDNATTRLCHINAIYLFPLPCRQEPYYAIPLA